MSSSFMVSSIKCVDGEPLLGKFDKIITIVLYYNPKLFKLIFWNYIFF